MADLHADGQCDRLPGLAVSSTAHLRSGFDLLGPSWFLVSMMIGETLPPPHPFETFQALTRDFGQVVVCVLHLKQRLEVIICFISKDSRPWHAMVSITSNPNFRKNKLANRIIC